MKTNRILFLFFVLILVANISYYFQINSSNYRQSPLIVSSGGEIVNSSSYKNYAATGIVAGVINSSTYKNWLGFFYGWCNCEGFWLSDRILGVLAKSTIRSFSANVGKDLQRNAGRSIRKPYRNEL